MNLVEERSKSILIIMRDEEIAEEIISFFSYLYSSSHPQFRGIDGFEWSPITAEDAVDLIRPFEEEEVKKAVFECDGNKSPGLDGFFWLSSKNVGMYSNQR